MKNTVNRAVIIRCITAAALIPFIIFCSVFPAFAEPGGADSDKTDLALDCKGAILMEASTGKVLYEQNADEALPPASVTKIMTLLLVMEALEKGTLKYDRMLTTSANAASMGGSQIYLEEGEQMSVEDLLKSVVISSANDAAVVLAEAVAGSETAFVTMMNKRAAALDMKTAHFENTNGLDDTVTNHVLSARDIALMSRALIAHSKILEYSSIWMDTVRDGAFGLTNTNRLIRFYPGANGLKTGSTSKARFCISATAQRDGMTLIAVIMASPTRDTRNAAAASLLDWGYANFALYKDEAGDAGEIHVTGGVENSCPAGYGEFCIVLPRGEEQRVEAVRELLPSVAAPVREGDKIGTVKYTLNGEIIGENNINAMQNVEKISFGGLLLRMLWRFFIS